MMTPEQLTALDAVLASGYRQLQKHGSHGLIDPDAVSSARLAIQELREEVERLRAEKAKC